MENKILEHWKETFSLLLELCKIKSNEKVVVLTETLSRQINISLVELVLKEHSLKYKKIEINSKPYSVDPIIRSTGASNILDFEDGNLKILKETDVIFDLSKEGLMHSKQTKEILSSGTRIMCISDEHPDILARLKPDLSLNSTDRGFLKFSYKMKPASFASFIASFEMLSQIFSL